MEIVRIEWGIYLSNSFITMAFDVLFPLAPFTNMV